MRPLPPAPLAQSAQNARFLPPVTQLTTALLLLLFPVPRGNRTACEPLTLLSPHLVARDQSPEVFRRTTMHDLGASEEELRYMTGFGNEFASEALPGALPQGQNNPRVSQGPCKSGKCAKGGRAPSVEQCPCYPH